MAIGKLYITGVAGQTFVQHPSLAYVEIMLCLREGKMLVETTGTPVGKQFKHVLNEGKAELDADIPIYGGNPANDMVLPEEFYFEYKSN